MYGSRLIEVKPSPAYYYICHSCKTYVVEDDPNDVEETHLNLVQSRHGLIDITWGTACALECSRIKPTDASKFKEFKKAGKLEGYVEWTKEQVAAFREPPRKLEDGEFWCFRCQTIHNIAGNRGRVLQGLSNNKVMSSTCACGHKFYFEKHTRGKHWDF